MATVQVQIFKLPKFHPLRRVLWFLSCLWSSYLVVVLMLILQIMIHLVLVVIIMMIRPSAQLRLFNVTLSTYNTNYGTIITIIPSSLLLQWSGRDHLSFSAMHFEWSLFSSPMLCVYDRYSSSNNPILSSVTAAVM